ncbi:MAG: hypothetical protein H7Y06_00405 [Opitutaceae bacterium]|nr:hypothetical protein [Opitutaceae bacterium]
MFRHYPRFSGVLIGVLSAALVSAQGRFNDYTKRFEKTPDQALVVGATLFGGQGTEWFSSGGFQPDGVVVATGTCLGPALESPVPVKVLGRDGAPPPPSPAVFKTDNRGKSQWVPPTWKNENAAGFIVRYSPDLRTVLSVSRLPWRSGSITSSVIGPQGEIYITGAAGDAIASIAAPARELPAQTASEAKSFSADHIYLAKLSPDGAKVLWVRTVRGPSAPPRVDINKNGQIMLQGPDLRAFTPDGDVQRTLLIPGGLDGVVAVNLLNGQYARGGERHSATGREPWRCPTLNIFLPTGEHLHELYNWTGPYVGMDNIRQVSDSAVRGIAYDDEGNLLINAWSDGGNSVMQQQPNDVRRNHGMFDRGLGMSVWGAGVLSAAYLIKIETANYKVTYGTLWLAYTPANKPNSARINEMAVARDGSVAIAGASAMGLIRTGNHLAAGSPPAGPYVALFSPKLDSLRFSTSLPACGRSVITGKTANFGIASGVVQGRNRVLFLSGAAASESVYGSPELPPPVTSGVAQPTFGGGATDGHLLLLELN